MTAKVIYIYPKKASFIHRDIAFLEKQYKVQQQELSWSKPLWLPINFVRQFLFLCRHVSSSQAIIISFAGYFSLLPVYLGNLFKVKTLVILNGTECVALPEYNYGSLRKKLLKFFVKQTLKRANKILPVDISLTKQIHTYDENIQHQQQGYLNFFPELKTPYTVVPNGFDTHFWTSETSVAKRRGFITVASIGSWDTAKLKGVDVILEMSRKYPSWQFTIVGVQESMQTTLEFPENITLYPFVTKEVLKKLYNEHEFYMQLSISEGFGCALAEAMLCGCIPIVSNVGALPNVIGNTGYIIRKKDIQEIAKVFRTAYYSEDKAIRMNNARKRIIENFPISKREDLFLHEIG